MKNKDKNWIVKEEDERPAGKGTGKCFYCASKIGEEHEWECVIRTRKVLVRAVVEYEVEVPESWNKENIEFHRNEGTWCSNNMIDELAKQFNDKNPDCLCSRTEFTYLKDL